MYFFQQILANHILIVAIFSWFVAQVIKILLEFWRTKRIDLKLIMSSGSMPSSHSSIVTAASVSIGIRYGFDTPLFALSSVLSMVVMYDASGVRRAAGKQAQVINMILDSAENIGIKLDKKLKEMLGHSPIEVFAGSLLGIIIAIWLN